MEPSPTPQAEGTVLSMGGFPAGIPLDAGQYRPNPGFDVQFTIDLSDGWRSIRDDTIGVISLVTRERNGIGHATHWLSFFPAPDASPEDLLAAIDSQPRIVAGEPAEVIVGGVAGTLVEARAKPNPGESGDEEVEPGTVPVAVINELVFGTIWSSETAEAMFRFIVLEVSGRTLLVYIEAPAADFDSFASDADNALAALSFES